MLLKLQLSTGPYDFLEADDATWVETVKRVCVRSFRIKTYLKHSDIDLFCSAN